MDVVEFARMELRYREKYDRPEPGKFGTYLGRGDGRIGGPKIRGDVTWDLYEDQGDVACDANLVGTISTEDNAEIRFDALGFFKRNEGSPKWSLSSAVRFRTDNEDYACFNDCIGLIVGTFDMSIYTHDYRLFAPRCAV